MTDARLRLAAAMGVLPVYTDQTGTERTTSVDTATALLSAMGLDAASEAEADAGLDASTSPLPRDVICTAGAAPEIWPEGAWQLHCEDGTQHEGRGPLPVLPLGIHRLQASAESWTLLAAPARLPLPDRCWGVIAPLYGLAQKGIGSFEDLAQLAEGLAGQGAGFLGLNPVHAGFPDAPDLFSPYTPSHRRRLNVTSLPSDTGTVGDLIDYRSEIPLKINALRHEFHASPKESAFLSWHARQGPSLQRFALHQALSERHGAFWNDWPAALQDPQSAASAAAASEMSDSLQFHAWLQWRAETALDTAQARARASGMRHGLYLDLAVGTHPFGAETWEDRDSFAFGASLGAPPDAFSADGQNWGLAPFNPAALRRTGYTALADTLRRQLRFAGLLRIDHILGFERAFWVPDGAPGGYVAMPRDAMLAVARIEAARAGATIVGEDLGNIPKGLQGALEASGILGCRVAIFERDQWEPPAFKPANGYSDAAIASFSTHDLPTWNGWRAGQDITEHARLGAFDAARVTKEQAKRQAEVKALDRHLSASTLDAMHGFLADTPSRLVALQIENLLGIAAQPNLPGTTDEYPNWRQRLPLPPLELARHDAITRAASIMAQAGRHGGETP